MWEIDHCIFKGSFGAPLGILPDQMHVVHLAIAPDAIVSSLLDWTDSEEYVSGSTREKRLAELWDHYRCFCEEAHIGDRASRKLFSVATLSPDSIGYIEVSQKKLSATAPRYMLYWLSSVAKDYASTYAKDADVYLDPSIHSIFHQFKYVFFFSMGVRNPETYTYIYRYYSRFPIFIVDYPLI